MGFKPSEQQERDSLQQAAHRARLVQVSFVFPQIAMIPEHRVGVPGEIEHFHAGMALTDPARKLVA